MDYFDKDNDELMCSKCDEPVDAPSTEEEEKAAEQGLCLRCYEASLAP